MGGRLRGHDVWLFVVRTAKIACVEASRVVRAAGRIGTIEADAVEHVLAGLLGEAEAATQ